MYIRYILESPESKWFSFKRFKLTKAANAWFRYAFGKCNIFVSLRKFDIQFPLGAEACNEHKI